MKSTLQLATAALLTAIAGIALAQGTATPTPPAPATTPATTATSKPALTATMRFQFVDTPVDTILNEMSTRFGFVIVTSTPIPGKISVTVPEELNAQQAVALLHSILMPLGYAVVSTRTEMTGPEGAERQVLKIGTFAEGKKAAPVGR